MCLHLHQDMGHIIMGSVVTIRIGVETFRPAPLDYRGVIRIGDKRSIRVCLVGVPDHRKERTPHYFPINHPVGIKNLVAAVFGVCLCKHHQFGIGWITFHARKVIKQVINLIIRERQPQLDIGLLQCCMAATDHIHVDQRLRLMM